MNKKTLKTKNVRSKVDLKTTIKQNKTRLVLSNSEIVSHVSTHLAFLRLVLLSSRSCCPPFSLPHPRLCESLVTQLSVTLFIVSLMCWMISQDDVCPGILSCWTIQLNMIMLSTLTRLNTQVNEQFTVKYRNIGSHLHDSKQYLFFYITISWFWLMRQIRDNINKFQHLEDLSKAKDIIIFRFILTKVIAKM